MPASFPGVQAKPRATDKLACAADRLSEAAVKLADAAEAQHQSAEMPQPSGLDAIPVRETEASGSVSQPE
jgi:hypothetical protein